MATMSGTDQSREAPVAAPDGMSAEFERLRGKLGLASGPAPRIEGRYQIHRTLGRGAMGEVHLAHDHRLGRTVALKVVRTNGAVDTATLRTRLEREALALARVDHPNVVHIFDVGSHDGQTYLTMQYIAGTTLRSWQAGRSHGEILGSYLQAARGLAAAHAVGVVHRDFKPKSRRPSQTAPQPTDRPHSHSQGRFERVDVYRAAPGRSGVPQVLAKRWQRTGPPEDRRGLAPRHSQGRHHEPFPSHPFATAAPRAAAGR
jgi:hypothetical protein